MSQDESFVHEEDGKNLDEKVKLARIFRHLKKKDLLMFQLPQSVCCDYDPYSSHFDHFFLKKITIDSLDGCELDLSEEPFENKEKMFRFSTAPSLESSQVLCLASTDTKNVYLSTKKNIQRQMTVGKIVEVPSSQKEAKEKSRKRKRKVSKHVFFPFGGNSVPQMISEEGERVLDEESDNKKKKKKRKEEKKKSKTS